MHYKKLQGIAEKKYKKQLRVLKKYVTLQRFNKH